VQAILYWQLAWNIYIENSKLIVNPKSVIWEAALNSCGLTLAFSTAALIAGLVDLVTTWKSNPNLTRYTTLQRATSVVWYVFQAIAECLIMFLLARALLASRSGMKRSDTIVNQLARNVIQTGLVATLWSMAALGTYFLLPRCTVFTIFNATSGSVYTHMIYDGLLSRSKLRIRLADQSQPELGIPSQSLSLSSHSHVVEGKRTSGVDRGHGTVSFITITKVTETVSDPSAVGRDANSDFDLELSAGSSGLAV